MPRRPEIIAHRGLPREHPENSLPGFAAALALGVEGIELDVHVTADGVLVVHHDPALGRPAVADAPLRGREIAALSYDELAAHELAPGAGVPTLREVLALVNRRATVYVEIKATDADARVAAELTDVTHWTAVHAFDHRIPYRVRRREPRLAAGILSSSYLLDNVAPLRAVDARDLWLHWAMVDAAVVREVHDAGCRLVAWTANEPGAMRALADMGVDAICTDVSAEALEALSAL